MPSSTNQTILKDQDANTNGDKEVLYLSRTSSSNINGKARTKPARPHLFPFLPSGAATPTTHGIGTDISGPALDDFVEFTAPGADHTEIGQIETITFGPQKSIAGNVTYVAFRPGIDVVDVNGQRHMCISHYKMLDDAAQNQITRIWPIWAKVAQ